MAPRTRKPLKFITSILSMGALVAAMAAVAPAEAGNRDTVGVVVGTAATLLILNELAKQNGNATIQVHDRHGGGGYHPRHDRWQQDRRGHGRYDRGPEPLPRECLIDTRRGLVMGERCLDRNYGASLPGACRTDFWFKGHRRDGYSYGCLRGRGYELSRR